ncbi:MAG: DUF6188 family protein [Ilumatobacteraceae bacterium]|nr:DUF6188 family protein [Ilumatobacteraceae bacterium]
MKKLTEGFDPACFVGRELETVLYASNLATLQFGDEVLITLLAEVALTSRTEGARCQDAPPWSSTRLPTLIGRLVESASADPSGRLILQFDGGSTLEFVPDESGYESFVVSVNGEEWVA